MSNGGLNAPLGDMAKWLAFLIGGAAAPGGPDAILKRASVDEMFTTRVRASMGKAAAEAMSRQACHVSSNATAASSSSATAAIRTASSSHLYIHRPSASGYIVSFNTDVSSKRDARNTTRAVDNDLRDVIIRQLFQPMSRR